MSNDLVSALMDTGILQFGQFKMHGELAPFRLCAEYLPAFPDVLTTVVDLAARHLDQLDVDRLIVPADSLPLGIGCALRTGLSLVYSQGRGETPVHDLVGVYDSGHKAVLIVNQLDDRVILPLSKIIFDARNVGLEVCSIIALMDVYQQPDMGGIPIYPIFQLQVVLDELSRMGRLSLNQAHTVLQWIDAHKS